MIDTTTKSLVLRVRDGFDRIALVGRRDLWVSAGKSGLNPVQVQVMGLLLGRPAGLRPKEIAAHLAISAPSMADTLAALARKGLIAREADPNDARSVILRATEAGVQVGAEIEAETSHVTNALAALPKQAQLLVTLISIIRQLQAAGAIPLQRVCISCCHFVANANPGTAKPHQCAFIDAAIGTRDLRLDCSEHQAAGPFIQAATWLEFAKATPILQAHP